MIRLLSSGLLLGWDTVTFWFLFLVAATLIANGIWFGIWAFVEWRVPESKRVRAAVEEKRHEILALKARMYDILSERDRAQKAEAKLRDFSEETRSMNRNLNARATEAMK